MKVFLKPGREKSIIARHPWIFSGAIDKMPSFTDGDILAVSSADGEHLGFGYFNRCSNITGRMLCFDDTDPLDAIKRHIKQAIYMRKVLLGDYTNAIRLINAEGDLLPGLIVDQYKDALVLQCSTLGIERLKGKIVEILLQELDPSWIFEASTSHSRKEEGLLAFKETIYGTPMDEIEVFEGDLRFVVCPLKGQKTGFFQDLRELRQLVRQHSNGKRVLNCFSYTGAFSCAALKGNASHCTSVDSSKEAIEIAKKHILMNGFAECSHVELIADSFDFLRDHHLDFDLIILDPPAFAKRKRDEVKALRAYQEINRTALLKMPNNSLLLTCSCSYHINEELFCKMLFHAAREAKRELAIVQPHRQALDHPVNIYHPEGRYLKSFLCYVR